jgi:hypothetical protein
MDRVLRNTAATITVTFYNGSTAVEADGLVTVIAKKADGTTLFSTNATNEAAVGVYSVIIPAQASLNILTLTWSGTFSGTVITIETVVEIVGGFYFTIGELRGYDSALSNTTRFPNQALIDARANVEAEFEDICSRAFVPRFYRETALVPDSDSNLIWTEKPEVFNITSLTVDGVDQIGWVTSNFIKRDKYSPRALRVTDAARATLYALDVTAEYEYGMTQVPLPIKQKALKRAKQLLLGQSSSIDERATTMLIPDVGTVNLATPGLRGAETGVPDIDVVLNRYKIDGGAGVF